MFEMQGWEYSAAMFILINTLALAFICYAYLRMINEIKASGVACRSTRQSQDREKVAQRFGIIVFTDCMCWVPVIIVKILALSGKSIRKVVSSCWYKRRTEHHQSASESGFSLSFGVFPLGGSSRRILSYRGTQSSSLTASKNSWKRSTAV
ncbi:hypothetical protein NQ314_021369 [Rhamnusium bicolor]|uniref:G-protein coupled receptors family 1 profile domain-containing protein n=1 Tax=Rhamnusium bicolor TaxID=1586634 RepID=A0AAV8WJM3_9CUCU|nr:hypothetical protein NQ314_021369 [Rhamnusium bicolor]